MKQQMPDHVAVTGDLVNVSLDVEFAAAALWLDTVGTPKDVTLVPGNHDAYIRRASGWAAQHWGEFSVVTTMRHFRSSPARAGRADRADDLAADRAVHGDRRLGGEQLAKLAEILVALGREPLFRVALILSADPNKRHYMKRLIDGPMFRALLKEHGAELVLHGHNHEQQLMSIDGPQGRIPAVGVPSASAIVSTHDEPAAYNLYSVDGGPGAWQCEMTVRGLALGARITKLKRERLIGSANCRRARRRCRTPRKRSGLRSKSRDE